MHLSQILPALVRRGHFVAVHTLTGGGPLARRLVEGGVEVAVPQRASGGGGFFARCLRAARTGLSLIGFMRRWRPDVVHFFLPEAYLVGAPLALAFGNARLAMARRSLNDYQRRRPLLARIERLLHGRMDALVGNAARVVEQLAEEGAPRERLHVIRNGVDLTRFEGAKSRYEARAMLGLGPEVLVLIVVANLIPYKGHEDLIDALAAVGRSMPDWICLCAGSGSARAETLAARAAAAGLGSRMAFLGARDDIPDLLAAADIAVLPSHEEGFPNAAVEAMAAGLPLVATRVGGVPEAAIGGVTGILVPPRDPAALRDAIVKLANSPELRGSMGAAGATRARAEFSLEACVARYVGLYEGLLVGKPLSGG
ncbi:MAG: glycosyltransferase [Rhodospirillales bacterium]|nr:glycosyltransferase [Rhodospirillales bacterium]